MDTHYLNEILQGNTAAFNHFVIKYQDRGFAIAMSVVKNEDNAKDVVQNSFIQAFDALASFKNDSKFSTWFYRIIINNALQFIAKQRRENEVMQEYTITESEKVVYNEALKKMTNDELKKVVTNVLEKLQNKEALVLQLYYIEEYSINEIQELTLFTKANIKVLMHRGRLNFYKNLSKEK